MIDVMLVDDQPSVRKSLRLLLGRYADIAVVSEAASGPEAVAGVAARVPDVVLMDVRMPAGDGISATRTLAGPPWHLPVLVMTTFDVDEYVFGAINAGAVGLLLKSSSPAQYAEAVRAAARGEGMISPQVTPRILAAAAQRGHAPTTSPEVLALTGREIEIVRALAEGTTTNEALAQLLHIEPVTVKGHLKRIMAKVQVRSRAELVAWAFRNGVVS